MRQIWSLRVVVGTALAVGVVFAGCSSSSTSGVSGRSAVSKQVSSWPDAREGSFVYPNAPRSAQLDVLHGVRVADPYRWLEDPDGDWTRRWVEDENKLTFGYLEGIDGRAAIKDRLTEVWNFERFGIPFKQGGRYFFTRNDGLQNQSVLYVADTLESEPRVLLDPNTFSEDATVSLAGYSVTEDGRYIAYGVSDGGSDWRIWRVRDIDSGEDMSDEVRWVKFSGASWLKDGSGFFYSRYDEPAQGDALQQANHYQKLFFHALGTEQSADVLIKQNLDEPEWGFGGEVSEDGQYLIIGNWWGTRQANNVLYKDLSDPEGQVIDLLSGFEAAYSFVGNDGTVFWFETNLDAPKGRVIAIDITNPEEDNWVELIPQSDDTLRSVGYVGGHLVASYLHDAQTLVKVFGVDGTHVRDVELPGIGTAGGFGGAGDDPETFYSFTGYTTPSTIYRYDIETGQSEVFRKPDVDLDTDAFETKQIFFSSKDGTQVPMFITHKKGLVLDGTNPTLLYGYGGFNIPLTPGFSITRSVWMEMGGVYAVANLRGGGEYGEEWHQAGSVLEKQNVFDDFIAAAEWLIGSGYTKPAKLAIQGGSNGGLLVGACMTQRPELFGACLPAVGVLDMLRFHKFTIGYAWVSDYGSPDIEEEFKVLYGYSPYHNVEVGVCYPPTMITTADHDDRVVPAHSFKFAAALQRAQGCDNPILIRIETRAGHGAGTPTSKRIEQYTDIWAFLVKTLDMEVSFDN